MTENDSVQEDFSNPNNVVQQHGYALHVMMGMTRRYFSALLQLNESTDFKDPATIMFMERMGGIDHIYSFIRIAEQIDLDKFYPDLIEKVRVLIKKLQEQGIVQNKAAPAADFFMSPGKTHIEDWAHECHYNDADNVRYAKWWFIQFGMPATMSLYFAKVMKPFHLYTTYQGKRFRVTGCSRLGDVWLRADHSKAEGYDHRIYVDDCSDWSDTP